MALFLPSSTACRDNIHVALFKLSWPALSSCTTHAELDIVSGGSGNMYDFGIIRIMWWTDGAISVGLKSVGSVLVAPRALLSTDDPRSWTPKLPHLARERRVRAAGRTPH